MNPEEKPLESWKEIGAYLNRDLRTARRWEKEEGLPVHRHSHKSRASVYAYPSEIDTWREARKVLPEPPPPPPLWKMLFGTRRSWAFGVTMALSLMMVGNGLRPQRVEAQDQQSSRRVWAGDSVDNSGAVSADGRSLTFTDWTTGDLAVRDLATGAVRRLTRQAAAYAEGYAIASVPSQDGKLVAYTWQMTRGAELRIVGGDTAGNRVLYSNPEFSYLEAVAFSADGKQILARLNASNESDRIAMISLASGKAQVLKTLAWGTLGRLALSPDGRKIAYDVKPQSSQQTSRLMLLASDGSRETALSEGTGTEQAFGWSPDSSSLLFASERTGSRDLWSVDVVEGAAKGEPKLVKRGIGNAQPMGITGSGELFYSENQSTLDVYVANWDWSTGKLVSEPVVLGRAFRGVNRNPVWSPDGTRVAYLSRPSPQRPDIVTLMTLESGEERQLSPSLPRMQRLMDWSRDGRSLLLMAFDEKNREGAYALDVESGQVRALAQAEGRQTIFTPQWLPDSKGIVYYRRDEVGVPSHLIVQDGATGEDREIEFGDPKAGYVFLSVSPDGTQVAYLREGVLGIVPVRGGSPRELYRATGADAELHLGTWSADSKEIVFESARNLGQREVNRQMWRISAAGGNPVRLESLITDSPRGSFRLNRDGSRVVFAGRQGNGTEVWALRNFLPSGGK